MSMFRSDAVTTTIGIAIAIVIIKCYSASGIIKKIEGVRNL